MTAPPHERKHPSWLLKIIEAKRRAFDALSDEEKAAALDTQKERRQRACTMRAQSLSLASQIFKLHDAGYTVSEIADRVGRRPWTIIHFAASRGVFWLRAPLIARAPSPCPATGKTRQRRAADYGKTAAEALDDLLTFSLDDDAAVARRVLRVKRHPMPIANSRVHET
jgi:hypothetical protein